jgi:hypothetical protein
MGKMSRLLTGAAFALGLSGTVALADPMGEELAAWPSVSEADLEGMSGRENDVTLLGKVKVDQSIETSDAYIGGDTGAITSSSLTNTSGITTVLMNTGVQANLSNSTVVNIYMQ